jgi:hypothetical protein
MHKTKLHQTLFEDRQSTHIKIFEEENSKEEEEDHHEELKKTNFNLYKMAKDTCKQPL